jgi:membrane protease YdiL (CAAX protease family)
MFMPKSDSATDSLVEAESQLKFAILSKWADEMVAPVEEEGEPVETEDEPDPTSESDSGGQFDLGDQFEDVLRLAEESESSRANRLIAALQFEMNGEVEEDVLIELEGSDSEADQNAAAIYSLEDLTPEEAAELSPDKSLGLTEELIAVHAADKAGIEGPRNELFSLGRFLPLLVGVFLMGGSISLGVILLLSLAVSLVMQQSSQRSIEWAGHPLSRGGLATSDALAMGAAALFVVYIAAGIVAGLFGVILDIQTLSMLLIGVIGIAAALLVFRLPFLSRKWNLKDALLGSDMKPMKQVGIGMMGFMANLPIALGLGFVGTKIFSFLPPPSHPIVEQFGSGEPWVVATSAIFVGAVYAPIFEEIAFRGLLLGALNNLLGKFWPALFLQAFLFAAIHPQGPALWLSLMSIGVTAGLLTRKTGGLLSAIVMHACHNFVILTLGLTLTS